MSFTYVFFLGNVFWTYMDIFNDGITKMKMMQWNYPITLCGDSDSDWFRATFLAGWGYFRAIHYCNRARRSINRATATEKRAGR